MTRCSTKLAESPATRGTRWQRTSKALTRTRGKTEDCLSLTERWCSRSPPLKSPRLAPALIKGSCRVFFSPPDFLLSPALNGARTVSAYSFHRLIFRSVIAYWKWKRAVQINPFTAQACKNFRAERCTDVPANSIYSTPITRLLSMLCVLMKILLHASAKKKSKSLKSEGVNQPFIAFHTIKKNNYVEILSVCAEILCSKLLSSLNEL